MSTRESNDWRSDRGRGMLSLQWSIVPRPAPRTEVSSEDATQITSTRRRMTMPRAIRRRCVKPLLWALIRFMINTHTICSLFRKQRGFFKKKKMRKFIGQTHRTRVPVCSLNVTPSLKGLGLPSLPGLAEVLQSSACKPGRSESKRRRGTQRT